MILVISICSEQTQRAWRCLACTWPTQTEQVLGCTDHELLLWCESELNLRDRFNQLDQLLSSLLITHLLNDRIVSPPKLVILYQELMLIAELSRPLVSCKLLCNLRLEEYIFKVFRGEAPLLSLTIELHSKHILHGLRCGPPSMRWHIKQHIVRQKRCVSIDILLHLDSVSMFHLFELRLHQLHNQRNSSHGLHWRHHVRSQCLVPLVIYSVRFGWEQAVQFQELVVGEPDQRLLLVLLCEDGCAARQDAEHEVLICVDEAHDLCVLET